MSRLFAAIAASGLLLLSGLSGCERAEARRAAAVAQAERAEAVSRWAVQLKASNPQLRVEAVLGLGAAGPEARIAVPGLLELMQDPELRPLVLKALGGIGPEAKMAVPSLIEALREDDPETRASAAAALARIGPEAIPELAAAVPSRSSLLSPGEREPWWEEVARKRPDSAIVGAVVVLLAAIIASVRIAQMWIKHRERLAGLPEAAEPVTSKRLA